jgi:hypothetical protein
MAANALACIEISDWDGDIRDRRQKPADVVSRPPNDAHGQSAGMILLAQQSHF